MSYSCSYYRGLGCGYGGFSGLSYGCDCGCDRFYRLGYGLGYGGYGYGFYCLFFYGGYGFFSFY